MLQYTRTTAGEAFLLLSSIFKGCSLLSERFDDMPRATGATEKYVSFCDL